MKRNRKIVLVLVSLFLLSALPTVASAQGRGRGRGQDKKIDKFVNGHDARDGRWTVAGPGAREWDTVIGGATVSMFRATGAGGRSK